MSGSKGFISSRLGSVFGILSSKEAIITFTLLFLVAVFDFSQRLYVNEPSTAVASFDENERFNFENMLTSVAKVEKWLAPFEEKKEALLDNVKQEPQVEQKPSPEEQLTALVEQGAYRIGADVVYLRGVLREEKQYALLTLVDRSMKPRFVSLKLGNKLGDYKLTHVGQLSIVLTSKSDSIEMQLFKNNEIR